MGIITSSNIVITFTTTQNQKSNTYNNTTIIDFEDCETSLRNNYNLTNNETIYIKKIDKIQDGMKALKVEYDAYAKLSGNNLINLNLTVCENNKISIFMPIILTGNLDKYNQSSKYYNDICYTTISEDGTDIILKDRQNEFIDKDLIVCQEDCYFSEYNHDTFKARCICNVKQCSESFEEMNINKAKILENFKNIYNFINFKFLVCYKKLFNKDILNNVGCYIIFSIIIFHIITIIILSIKQFSLIKKIIKKIVSVKYKNFLKRKEKKDSLEKHQFKTKVLSTQKNFGKKIKKINHCFNKNLCNNSKIKMNLHHSKIPKDKKKKKSNNKYITDEEINGFSYDMSLKYDKRTYCQYYISLLKTKHNLISVFNDNDYNYKIIKFNLFLIGFTIEYTINALFYNDDTMHKIYKTKGEFDIETQIPIAVYSTIISNILNYPLNFFGLSNDPIINFKQDNSIINIKKRTKLLIKNLIIKFILYFIISFLFLLFCWYYISIFGVIYKNTQMHLLKDTLISIGLSLIFPLIIYLLPGIFRIPSLSNKKRKCLYNFSKILQLF